jgi:hypothetical protein
VKFFLCNLFISSCEKKGDWAWIPHEQEGWIAVKVELVNGSLATGVATDGVVSFAQTS